MIGRKCFVKLLIVEGKVGNNFLWRMLLMDMFKMYIKLFIYDLYNKVYEEDVEIDIIDLWIVMVLNGNMVSKCIVFDNFS